MQNTKIYHELVQKMRTFFLNRGFYEVPTQSRLSILAACENPHSITTFEYQGQIWPLPQTGQMWLEYELLKNPEWPGVFCISTSYRQEKNPIPGRHELIFPMFEFESKGGMEELKRLELELLLFLGFDIPEEVNYDDVCNEYGANFVRVHQAWTEDGRVDPMHTRSVESNRGWNSKCWNKDALAFANLAGSAMLKGMIDDNQRHLELNEQQDMVGRRDKS